MIEPELQALILELAGIYRWLRYHTADSRKSHRGFPDLQLLRVEPFPRLIVAELKGDTEYGKKGPTDDQRRWLDYFSSLGPPVEVYLWTPSQWPGIQQILSPNWRPAAHQPRRAHATQ